MRSSTRLWSRYQSLHQYWPSAKRWPRASTSTAAAEHEGISGDAVCAEGIGEPDGKGLYFNVIKEKIAEWCTSPPLTYVTLSCLLKLFEKSAPSSMSGE